ncbi:MAG: VWA domain-containing protein [Muribaculaceae bacterium]
MTFAHPNYLWLLLILIPLALWYVLRRKKSHATMLVTSLSPFKKLSTSWKVWLMHLMFVFRLLAVACLIVIIARPQTHDSWSTSETEGTDIVVSLDISTSMLAQDFRPNRFEAAKDVACQFVSGRETDNIGFVIFAAESFTQVPMTTDKAALINAIQNIEMGALEDGTAIGDGIATAINRIKEGKAKSKSIILLTDGSNNTGIVAPLTAASIAREKGIKIYTIGVGSNGTALYPVGTNMYGRMEYQRLPVVIDEATLKSIASSTGGKYFRATSKNVLKDVFAEIDALEKTQMDIRNFSHTEDYYMPWAIALLLLLCIDILSRYTILRTIP